VGANAGLEHRGECWPPGEQHRSIDILGDDVCRNSVSTAAPDDVLGLGQRRQVHVIEYLKEENRILKERLGGKRVQFSDAESDSFARSRKSA
jgi:hypothetical protein